MNPTWKITSGDISEFVCASNQFEAWETLRDRPAEEFGAIVLAEPDGNDNPFIVRTSQLMYRWGRDGDAERFISLMMEAGMPDTTIEDLSAAGR